MQLSWKVHPDSPYQKYCREVTMNDWAWLRAANLRTVSGMVTLGFPEIASSRP